MTYTELTYLPELTQLLPTNCLTACLPAWLPTWLTAWLPGCLPAGLPDWQPDWLCACQTAYPIDCLPNWLPDWLTVRLTACLPDCLHPLSHIVTHPGTPPSTSHISDPRFIVSPVQKIPDKSPLYKFSLNYSRGVLSGGLCQRVFCLEGSIRGFCPFPLLSEYICYNRKLNITLNFMFHVYDKKF